MAVVRLSSWSCSAAAVAWSQDHRLAVATEDAAYVTTLKRTHSVSESAPPYVVTMAVLPAPKLRVPRHSSVYSAGQEVSQFLDRAKTGGDDSCREVLWSPTGCSSLGGCLLTCHTHLGRVLLFSPPSSATANWKLACDLSHALVSELNERDSPADGRDADSQEPSHGRLKEDQSRAVSATAVAWLPQLVRGGRGAVVAIATKNGSLVIWLLPVPFKDSPQLMCLTDLPISCSEDWATSLQWASTGPGASLAVGCCSGALLVLRWESLEQPALPSPQIGLLVTPDVEAAIQHLAWDGQEEGEVRWLVAGTSVRLEAVPVVWDSLRSGGPSLVIQGCHNLPLSGLCSWAREGVLATSVDGFLQKITLPHYSSCDRHVTAQSIAIDIAPSSSVHGVTVSANGLFAAIVSNSKVKKSSKRSQYCLLHLIPLNHAHPPHLCGEWDVCEWLRLNYVCVNSFPSYVNSLLAKEAQLLSCDEKRLCLQAYNMLQQESNAIKCHLLLMTSHLAWSLQCWLDTHPPTTTVGELSLQLMCQHMLSSNLASASDKTLAQQVRSLLSADQVEPCPLCGENISLTDLETECCALGHQWRRCSLTLLLTSDPYCSQCIQCSRPAHNTQSLSPRPGSWLQYLLLNRQNCVSCGGHFEQLV